MNDGSAVVKSGVLESNTSGGSEALEAFNAVLRMLDAYIREEGKLLVRDGFKKVRTEISAMRKHAEMGDIESVRKAWRL